LISKLIYDVEQVAGAVTDAVTGIIRDTLTIVGLLGWMFYLNWKLTLVLLVIAPPVALIIFYVNKKFRRVSGKIQNSMGDVTHVAEEGIEAHRVIKTFGGQAYEEKQFETANESNRRLNMKMISISSASVPIIQFIAAMALAGIIYFSTLKPVLGEVTVGTFMSFVAAMMMLLVPIKGLTSVNAIIQRAIAAAQSIFGLLDRAPEEDEGTLHLQRAAGAVEYRHVSFMYDAAKGDVLEDVSFRIEPGQVVAFVGRSGSGK
jgi:subfamily B ATP-binding cassette protein MsbA